MTRMSFCLRTTMKSFKNCTESNEMFFLCSISVGGVRRTGCSVGVTVAVGVAASVGVGVAEGLGVALTGWGVSVGLPVATGTGVDVESGANAACLHPPSKRPIDTSIVKIHREFIAYHLNILGKLLSYGGFDMAAGQHRRLPFDSPSTSSGYQLRTPLNHRLRREFIATFKRLYRFCRENSPQSIHERSLPQRMKI
jgi:hypothetical protein